MSDTDPASGFMHFISKLRAFSALSRDEEAALCALPMTVTTLPAQHELLREGDVPTVCHLLLDGLACRHKSLTDGRRQILSFHVPGDLPDLQGLYLSVMDYGVEMLSPSTIARIPHEGLHALIGRYPGIAMAMRLDAIVDGAIFREWMLGLGRRSVREHMAHMLCELVTRMKAVKLSGEMPLTETSIADALGLHSAQVRRELHLLQRDGLVEARDGSLHVVDFNGLRRLCDFDPGYLHQEGRA